mmetsp:Transcript_35622/g.82785  ORF Transcript_35622/g.82785 Transcript_35622/m.82785 type:complete len:139 (-) Transcript_35622:1051-1467(-)
MQKLSRQYRLIWPVLTAVAIVSYASTTVLLLYGIEKNGVGNGVSQIQKFGGNLQSHTTNRKFPTLRYFGAVSTIPTSVQEKYEFDVDSIKSRPFVHVVSTRFMQYQASLTHLAAARLALFRTICLPSMVQQKSQNFLW